MIENNGEIISLTSDTSKIGLCVSCIICGESIELTNLEEMASRCGQPIFKVCDECKAAVMKMREMK